MNPDETSVLAAGLRARHHLLTRAVVDRQYRLQPALATRYGAAGRERCQEDANFHLRVLTEAVRVDTPELFLDYIGWAAVMLDRRGIPAHDLAQHLGLMRALLEEELGSAAARPASTLLESAAQAIAAPPPEPPGFLEERGPLSGLARQYLELALGGQRQQASQRVMGAADGGTSVAALYLDVFQPCQREIGRLWQINRISVAQEHHVSAVTQLTMSRLYSFIAAQAGAPESAVAPAGRLVATCAAGDLHEIGLRMVADLLEQAGWEVCYLGANTPNMAVKTMLIERSADLLLISASLSMHLSAVQSLIDLVRADRSCDAVKILVGGYPFNLSPQLWQRMGADGHASDAKGAVALAATLKAGPAAQGA